MKQLLPYFLFGYETSCGNGDVLGGTMYSSK